MTDQEITICQNCSQPHPATETHCPLCGEVNSLYLEEELIDTYNDPPKRRRPWMRSHIGCASIIIVLILILCGTVLGGYEGLKERSLARQIEVNTIYQQALTHFENNETDLAIAALSKTLSLDPTHSEARELLNQLRINQEQTPTPTSETRQNVASDMFNEAKALTRQGNWEAARELLIQIRDIDPGFEPDLVSETLYTANYEIGLRLLLENKLPEALRAFDEALVEHPNDPQVTAEWEKVSLYLSLVNNNPASFEDRIIILKRLYEMDPDFADVQERLYTTYKNFGDSLAADDEWCLAYPRYQAAANISSNNDLEIQRSDAQFRCEAAQQPTPTATPKALSAISPTSTPNAARPISATATVTASAIITAGRGDIYLSRLDSINNLWQIIAFSLSSGEETVVAANATQPNIRVGGLTLAYHSEAANSIGLHALNLNTGEDIRVTVFNEDVLPRWGGSNEQFVFASRRSGDRRWQIFTSFADGKSEAIFIQNGRTPALSYLDNLVVYQGADVQGNNPGLYAIPLSGGESTRITEHESDRSPAFSPAANQIAFMSTRNGNWDIWTVSGNGGAPRALAVSPGNDGLPVWSPDGTQVAFVSDRDGTWGIYIINISGGQAAKITNWTQHPDWLREQLSWGR